MNFSEQQFEQNLDDALTLKRAGKTQAEINQIFADDALNISELTKLTEQIEECFVKDRVWKNLQETVLTKPKQNAGNMWQTLFGEKLVFSALTICVVMAAVGVYWYRIPNQTQSTINKTFTTTTIALQGVANDPGIKTSAGIGERGNISLLSILSLPKMQPPPVSDNRELFKTSFGAIIKTRAVTETVSRIRTIIRGYNGRVDAVNASEKEALVEFVIPRSEFSDFKQELTGVVGKKFIQISERSNNLIAEQRDIEQVINAARLNNYTQTTVDQLYALREQEKKLREKTETITGTIIISRISILKLITTYVSAGWFIFGLILIIVWSVWRRKKIE